MEKQKGNRNVENSHRPRSRWRPHYRVVAFRTRSGKRGWRMWTGCMARPLGSLPGYALHGSASGWRLPGRIPRVRQWLPSRILARSVRPLPQHAVSRPPSERQLEVTSRTCRRTRSRDAKTAFGRSFCFGGTALSGERRAPNNKAAPGAACRLVSLCQFRKSWSGRRDSNPRPRPWQGRALPLSYTRIREIGGERSPATRRAMPNAAHECNSPRKARKDQERPGIRSTRGYWRHFAAFPPESPRFGFHRLQIGRPGAN